MKAKQKKTWWSRVLVGLGVAMILAGIGCVGLFFVGPPGGTAGIIPTESISSQSDPNPTPQDVRKAAEEGPANKTLYLTVPKLGLKDLMVHDSLSEEKLAESAIHVPKTGFPWQQGANSYIAGHRMGFLGTGSFLVFFRLNELASGDEIILEDSLGKEYLYRVTGSMVVTPQDVEVLEPVAGKSIISLQTCTLPTFSDRLVVQGELVA